jgi:hypothetical protein
MGLVRRLVCIVFLLAGVLAGSMCLLCLVRWQNAKADPELPFFIAFHGGVAGVAFLAAGVARWG